MLPSVSSKPSAPLLLNLLVWLAASSVFPLERGAAVGWDLGAVMLAPVLLRLLPAAGRKCWLVPAALGAALLAGPRTGSFLDADLSLRRYARVVEREGDAEGLEELAVHMRGLGRLRPAESLLRRAFETSGNGRHLAQLSEVLRMQGRPEEALEAAAEAAESRRRRPGRKRPSRRKWSSIARASWTPTWAAAVPRPPASSPPEWPPRYPRRTAAGRPQWAGSAL